MHIEQNKTLSNDTRLDYLYTKTAVFHFFAAAFMLIKTSSFPQIFVEYLHLITYRILYTFQDVSEGAGVTDPYDRVYVEPVQAARVPDQPQPRRHV